jgi:hypothetical protein
LGGLGAFCRSSIVGGLYFQLEVFLGRRRGEGFMGRDLGRGTRGKVFRVFDEDPAVGIETSDGLIFVTNEEGHITGFRVDKLTCEFKRLNSWKRFFNHVIFLLQLNRANSREIMPH